MTGTTPATAPSKRSYTPCSRAVAHSSSPWTDSSCLLADTTCLPARIARSTYSRAGSRPPISSTIRSDPSRISSNEPRERVSTPDSSGRAPVIASIAPARSASSASNAEPTVPWPSRPTLNVAGNQVLQRLAPHRHPRLAAGAEDHGRPRHAVVVVRQRVAVRARGGRHHAVPRARAAQPYAPGDDVARLAVLAGQMAALARVGLRAQPVRDVRRVG